MSHPPAAHVALLVDFANLQMGMHAGAAEETEGPPARDMAQALVHFAGGLGRVGVSRAYADWSRMPALAQQLRASRLRPVLVPATEAGEDRSHIRLTVDAMEALFNGDEPDAFVIASGDATLVPMVQALRDDGSEVIVVAGEAVAAEEMREAADRFVAMEDVMAGVDAERAIPRAWRLEGPGARGRPARGGGEARGRDRGPRPGAGREEEGRESSWQGGLVTDETFDHYDWVPFIHLIDELERRLPFVGVRYLVNKVLAPHNCGIADPRLKRDLINRAMDDGLIEMYSVGNVDNRMDPVTACRLARDHDQVQDLLGAREDADVTDTGTPEYAR